MKLTISLILTLGILSACGAPSLTWHETLESAQSEAAKNRT